MIWDDGRVIAVDFETSGTLPEYALQPWRIETNDFWATSISVIRMTGGKLVPAGSELLVGLGSRTIEDRLRAILQLAIADDEYLLCWNAAFDISVFVAYGCGDLVHKVKWIDGMLLWKHATIEPEYDLDRSKKKSYSLKAAVPEFLPVEHRGYESEIDFHATDPASLAKLQRYNDRDSVYTWIISKVIWDTMLDVRQRNAAVIEAECLSMVAEANLRGMPVDVPIVAELAAKLTKDAADKLAILAQHGVTEQVVRSPLKMAKLLFDDWGLPVFKENVGKKTGKVSRATDKEVLHELAFMDPRCADLRGYREALNNRTKFADTPLLAARYNGDGRARPSAIVFGTYSGRLTYSSSQGKGVNTKQTGFALHQEKRGTDFRSIIASPPGYTLMEFDASGQEFRWMAVLSGDPTMLNLCLPGEDPHSYMGGAVTGMPYADVVRQVAEGVPVAKNARQLGKVANLSLQYRTYPKTLRKVARVDFGIPLEIDEARRIHRTYQQTYPEVPRYWQRQISKSRQLGYVETLAGRRVQLVGDWSGPKSWSMESTSLNYPVQGTGAEQKYLAMKVIKPHLTTLDSYFAWDLHDGIYLWVPDAMVERAAVEIKNLLDHLPYQQEWGFTPPIPLPWDCKAGSLWGTLKEWNYGNTI